MAEQVYSDVINDVIAFPTASTTFQRLQPLGAAFGVDLEAMFKVLKVRTTPIDFYAASVTASSTAEIIFEAPWPMKIRAFTGQLRSLNSAASLTADVQVKDGSASYVSVLDAATTLTTAIADPVTFAPEETDPIDALCLLNQGDNVKVIFTAGSGGNPDNCLVRMFWEHRDS